MALRPQQPYAKQDKNGLHRGGAEQVLYRTSFWCPHTVMGGRQVGKMQSASIPALAGGGPVGKDCPAFGKPTIGDEEVISVFTKVTLHYSR